MISNARCNNLPADGFAAGCAWLCQQLAVNCSDVHHGDVATVHNGHGDRHIRQYRRGLGFLRERLLRGSPDVEVLVQA